jgi:hypothetical protein
MKKLAAKFQNISAYIYRAEFLLGLLDLRGSIRYMCP